MKHQLTAVFWGIAAMGAFTVAAVAKPAPKYDRVALLPIDIKVIHFAKVTPRPDEDAEAARLRQFATERVAHNLVQNGIAAEVVQVASGETPPPDMPLVSGSVSIPISIPKQWLGMNAHYQSNFLASADMTFRSGSDVLAARHDPIRWKDVEWCRHYWTRTGLWHIANRPTDDVLTDAVNGTVDRAIRRASKQLSAANKSK